MLVFAALLAAPCNIHPAYTVNPVVTRVRVVRRGRGYLAAAQIRFTLATKSPAMIASADDPGVLQHVQGHLTVARRVVQSSEGSVQANGSTASQARTRLNQTIARMRSDLQKELTREEQAYENVTENGTSQSQGPAYGFPGGPDVQSPCARP
jgi:hypothetical protein